MPELISKKKNKNFNKIKNIPKKLWFKLSFLQKKRILFKYYNGHKIIYINNKLIVDTKK